MWQAESPTIRAALGLFVPSMGCLRAVVSLRQRSEALQSVRAASPVESIVPVNRTLFKTFIAPRIERGLRIVATLADRRADSDAADSDAKDRVATNRKLFGEGCQGGLIAVRVEDRTAARRSDTPRRLGDQVECGV